MSVGTKHQRSKRVNLRAVAHAWAATGVELMVRHSREECGRQAARGSRHWQQALQYLAFVALKKGHGKVHLSVAQIARHTGIDERTVQRITALAQASGVLILEERGGRRRRGGQVQHRANSWRLNPSCHRQPAGKTTRSARRTDANPVKSTDLMGDTFAGADPLRGLETPPGGAESAPPEQVTLTDKDREAAERLFRWVKTPKPQRQPFD